MNSRLKLTLCATATALSLFAPATVSAQTVETTDSETNALKRLDSITVTSQRREQTLLEVPVAVSVVTGETLNNALLTNIEDIQRIAPSVSVAGSLSPTGNSIRIRGVGTYVFSGTQRFDRDRWCGAPPK